MTILAFRGGGVLTCTVSTGMAYAKSLSVSFTEPVTSRRDIAAIKSPGREWICQFICSYMYICMCEISIVNKVFQVNNVCYIYY